ncbi:uncharacterized protein N7511_002283 [Penicillium nucicola]|uniref:uncharacterized protein n=1 Tax=Penicillium nucicola TaxID=1850975 RepID=UPI0025451C45|nr:uncharacterized protein N7511_002283 [Penicillium nucicola]KAJ5770232.1 hypothetical protein N7511_002283 [Penicillium nucicola]
MMGNQNCHAEIMFDDGVKWLARFRLTRTSTPPRQVCDCILQSEAATMTYLQRNTQIPSPRIFDWACESSPGNALGVDYIMMEKLDGKPLNWQGATLQQKEKVMQQLVEILLEIEKHPFKSIGSPILVEDEIQIQGLTYPSTFQAGKGRLGPFPSALEWIQATLKAYLTMIASGEIDPCCPIETYLVHRFRQEIIDSLLTDIPADEQFFLKHPDDKGDHILVNESFDIVGIIDWEWTQTVTKAEAFSSPCMMWPVGAFYDGFNELAVDELRLADIFRERGRKDLADYVIKCRKLQRFFFALGVEGSFLDADTLPPLFTGLRRAFEFEDEGWEAWKSKALIQWKDDKMLLDLIARNGPRCGGTSRPVEPWTAKTP